MASQLLRRKVIVGSITGVAVVAAASSAWALTAGASGTSYRVATVTRGSVVQSLTTTGAVSPMRTADLDFQVAGTVGRMLVPAQASTSSAGGRWHGSTAPSCAPP